MIGFLTSIPSAILLSVAQQILCKKETGDTNPSPGDYFSFGSLFSSLFMISDAIGPAQKASLDTAPLCDSGTPELFHCSKAATGKDAQASPSPRNHTSLFLGFQDLQTLLCSISGQNATNPNPLQILSNIPSLGEGGKMGFGAGNEKYMYSNDQNLVSGTGTRNELAIDMKTATHCNGNNEKFPFISGMPYASEHTPQALAILERNNGILQSTSNEFTYAAADKSTCVTDFKGVMKTERMDSLSQAEANARMRNPAHVLQEWFLVSDDQINRGGGGIVPGAFMRQGNSETKEDADAPSLHNLRNSVHDSILSAGIVSNESLQREGTHEVLSVSPGVNRDVTGLTYEKIHLIRSGNTITIHMEPEGLGKLNIHLNLERGMLHTLINTSHDTVRDFLREQSWHIMNTLMQEGLNVGSFSVSLSGGGTGWESQMSQERAFSKPSEERETDPVNDHGQGLISIFI